MTFSRQQENWETPLKHNLWWQRVENKMTTSPSCIFESDKETEKYCVSPCAKKQWESSRVQKEFLPDQYALVFSFPEKETGF